VNEYSYDALDRLVEVQQRQDPFGNTVSEKRVDFTYHRDNQLASVTRYADLQGTQLVATSTYSYDSSGRAASLTHKHGSTIYAGYSFSYDEEKRLTGFTNSAHTNENAIYTYDERGQLLVESTSNGGIAYVYDDNGNRVASGNPLFEEQWYADHTIGPQNRVVEREYFLGTYDYTYDNEGNRVTEFIDSNNDNLWSIGEPGIEYTWDHRNRLTKVTYKNGPAATSVKTVDYAYDSFNQLVKRIVDLDGASGATAIDQTFYLYDEGQVVFEFHKTGTGSAEDLAHRYLWGPGVDELLADEAMSQGEPTYWALPDHLGSVREIIDSSGLLRIHRDFDAFGNVTSETHYDTQGAVVTPGQTGYVDVSFGFTGRFFDKSTGLQNNLHRWYDANVGRWISEDPIGFAAGDANLYRYVQNIPTSLVDPLGLAPSEDGWGSEQKVPDWKDIPEGIYQSTPEMQAAVDGLLEELEDVPGLDTGGAAFGLGLIAAGGLNKLADLDLPPLRVDIPITIFEGTPFGTPLTGGITASPSVTEGDIPIRIDIDYGPIQIGIDPKTGETTVNGEIRW
jgi:RHS repeat-associated protein